MTAISTKDRTVLGTVEVNGGRDRGELVREADPDTGLPVMHVIVLTTSYVDRLYADGRLSRDAREGADMRDAAARLLKDWLEAGVSVGHARAGDPMRSGGGGARADIEVRDEDAYRRYAAALASLTTLDASIARRAVIGEQPCVITALQSALAGLVRHYRGTGR